MIKVDPEGKRKTAQEVGAMTYFTGLPCVNNHLAPRYTSNNICEVCQQENSKRRYAKDRDKCLAVAQVWREKNRVHVNQYTKDYRQKFPEQVKKAGADSKKKNRVHHTSLERKRLAVKLNALPKWLTTYDHECIKNVYKMAKSLQKQSGIKMEVDHIVPLQGKTVCGLHVPWNLQVLSKQENLIKHASLTDDAYLPKPTGVMVGRSGLPWNWS